MSRYLAYAIALLMTVVSVVLVAMGQVDWRWGVLAFGALSALGTWDLLQARSTLRRNYPLLAHFRYGLESIGPEIRQYFIQADIEKVPFSRDQRSLVYQRAKGVMDVVPFGSELDVYGNQYEWINHSIAPAEFHHHDYRIAIGAGCAKPYSASVFNISAMSFGALSANAIRALNKGAKLGGFYHDTGEGSPGAAASSAAAEVAPSLTATAPAPSPAAATAAVPAPTSRTRNAADNTGARRVPVADALARETRPIDTSPAVAAPPREEAPAAPRRFGIMASAELSTLR